MNPTKPIPVRTCAVCLRLKPGEPSRDVTDLVRSLCTLHAGAPLETEHLEVSGVETTEAYEAFLARQGGKPRDPCARAGLDPKRFHYLSHPGLVAERLAEGYRHDGRSTVLGGKYGCMEAISIPLEWKAARDRLKGKRAREALADEQLEKDLEQKAGEAGAPMTRSVKFTEERI